MNKFSLSIILLSFSCTVFAQNLIDADTDSLERKHIPYTPYFSEPYLASGNYSRTINDSSLFLMSSGVSIFNALRGQVPGLFIPSNVDYASAGNVSKPDKI